MPSDVPATARMSRVAQNLAWHSLGRSDFDLAVQSVHLPFQVCIAVYIAGAMAGLNFVFECFLLGLLFSFVVL